MLILIELATDYKSPESLIFQQIFSPFSVLKLLLLLLLVFLNFLASFFLPVMQFELLRSRQVSECAAVVASAAAAANIQTRRPIKKTSALKNSCPQKSLFSFFEFCNESGLEFFQTSFTNLISIDITFH